MLDKGWGRMALRDASSPLCSFQQWSGNLLCQACACPGQMPCVCLLGAFVLAGTDLMCVLTASSLPPCDQAGTALPYAYFLVQRRWTT